jgi:hypothetical protein
MNPQRRDVMVFLLQNLNAQMAQLHQMLARRRRHRRRQQIRAVWTRNWITRRPEQGLYDRLMVELKNEDPIAFQNFMRMPPDMFDELLQRLTPGSPRRLQSGDLP